MSPCIHWIVSIFVMCSFQIFHRLGEWLTKQNTKKDFVFFGGYYHGTILVGSHEIFTMSPGFFVGKVVSWNIWYPRRCRWRWPFRLPCFLACFDDVNMLRIGCVRWRTAEAIKHHQTNKKHIKTSSIAPMLRKQSDLETSLKFHPLFKPALPGLVHSMFDPKLQLRFRWWNRQVCSSKSHPYPKPKCMMPPNGINDS